MPEPDWYDVANEDVIHQGDILSSFPVPVVAELPWPIPDGHKPAVDLLYYDLVVMTQSCDLVNDKVDEVLFAQVIVWEKVLATGDHFKKKEFRSSLVNGNVPPLSLLAKREEAPAIPWAVVNFHRLFTVPKGFVRRDAAACGPRLRLRSPYREHLSQAFARYFMRVGLPHDAKAFVQEGAAK